ncbi:hypothetical protein DYH09_20740 [bacterium CPR1]|nr:hypothetical protein [bacterium CPR1]
MQIESPTREQAVIALRARSAELIREGNMRGAEQVQRDQVLLSGARGETLYDMHRHASQKASIRFPQDETLGDALTWNPGLMLGTILGTIGGVVALGAGLSTGSPVALGAGVALLATTGGGILWLKNRIDQRNQGQDVLRAIESNQDYIRGYTPAAAPPEVQIDRKVFLAALQAQEAKLASAGKYARAGEMRKVHESLSGLEGKTVEELFQNLIASSNREVLDLVQGSLSADIAESIETLAEVSKLVGAQGQALLREDGDSLVIGGVVLKKRAEAAAA